jgi:alpha-beta hydrolase superfamily lysophospholipase
MHDPSASTFTLAGDGVDLVVDAWLPDGPAKASVVVAHGMAEHAARYARFGRALAARRYAVYAPDHRGHGRTAGGDDRLGWAGADGWNGIVRDLGRLLAHVRAQHPGVPQFAFGHSMGSMLAQRVAQLHGAELAGLILSGTTGSAPNLGAGIAAARTMALLRGDRAPSSLQRVMFADFNKPFAPEPGFEWLSRDEDEVRKYVDDPLSGFTFSNRLLLDMLRGYAQTWKPENERRLPVTLPVLLFAGELDPVGRKTVAVTQLADRYRALGLRDVQTRFYAGGRHEMLNETNRDEVTGDVIAWLDAHV